MIESDAIHHDDERVTGSSSSVSGRGNSPEVINPDSGGQISETGVINGDLEVHFINPNSRVDAIYIKAGDKSLFIDGGFKRDGVTEANYLDKIGVTHIDYYIASHSHKNHVEAAPHIISKYGIKQVYTGYNTCINSGSSPCSKYTIRFFADEQNVSLDGVNFTALKPGDSFQLGDMNFLCVGPMKVINNINRGSVSQNYNSILLRLEYGSVSFLFTGDNSSTSNINESNNAFPGKLKVNVYKNAHHNSNNRESYNIFQAEYVVFLTNNDNLPKQGTIDNIRKAGGKETYIVTGNRNGNVVFSSDGTTINVKSNYNP